MKISDAIAQINSLADESEPSARILDFINQCTSKINIECASVFPIYKVTDSLEQEFPIPDAWAYSLYIPFGVGRLKTVDSSQFEYTDSYAEFRDNLADFKSKYVISDAYKADATTVNNGSVASDVFMNPPYSWFTF